VIDPCETPNIIDSEEKQGLFALCFQGDQGSAMSTALFGLNGAQ